MTIPYKTVLIVAGPTASGKTKLAIDLALAFDTVIISADSRQCYRELCIGVARPSADELATVPHYFIASHSIHDEITASFYEEYALQLTTKLFEEHDVIVMVGGTGLYLRAFCYGIDPIPATDPQIRVDIQSGYRQFGMDWLVNELTSKDPQFFRQGESQNPHRVMRALEVVISTGNSILSYQSGQPKTRPFRIIQTAIHVEREELNQRIDERVEIMMEHGLFNEVKSLLPYRQLNALQTVGYKELFDFIDGKPSLDEAVKLIKQHTRQYAKRQVTWFKKDPSVRWVNYNDVDKIMSMIRS